jgi:N-acetylmuramoyl-L-alanine amidase
VSSTRAERRGRRRRRSDWLLPVGAVLAILLVLGGIAYALTRAPKATGTVNAVAVQEPLPDKSLSGQDGSVTAAASTLSADASAGLEVEVPDVVGRSVTEAETLLQAAGFKTLTRVADTPFPGAVADTVVLQAPAAGIHAQSGSRVIVTYQPAGSAPGGRQYVVVIDPGHQQRADLKMEPIGPGSPTKKYRVAGGATGVKSGIPEYKAVLQISLKLRDALQAQGVKVVMVRTTDDVDISNAERAKIGNAADADLVVRVHLNGSSRQSDRGIMTLYPSGNAWVRPIEAASKSAAALVEASVTSATGAKKWALQPHSDMTGFNWSTRPAVIVECGFLSNPTDDVLCTKDAAYQGKIASGISGGVMQYLHTL